MKAQFAALHPERFLTIWRNACPGAPIDFCPVARIALVACIVLAVALRGLGVTCHHAETVHFEPQALGLVASHCHHTHDAHHGHGHEHEQLAPVAHEHESGVPGHVHVGQCEEAQPQVRALQVDLQKLIPTVVAVISWPELCRVPPRMAVMKAHDRWAIGPPPAILTTHILI